MDPPCQDVDRGWAWVVLFATVLNMMLQAFFIVSAGIFQIEFVEAFSSSSTGFIALIGAMSACGQTLLGPVAGILSSAVTPRVTIMLGSVLITAGLVGASFSTDLLTLVIFYGVIAGAGSGLAYTPSVTFITVYFVRYRVIVNGLILAAPGLGVLAGPYLLRWLIETQGWRLSLAACGCLMAQMCVLAALLFTPPAQQSGPACTWCCKKPPKAQLLRVETLLSSSPSADGEAMYGSKIGLKMSDLGSVFLTDSLVWTVDPARPDTPSLRQRLVNLLRLRFMWVMCLNQFLLYAGFSVNSILFPSYAQSVGVAFSDIPALYTVYGTSMIVSRVAAGFLFNRLSQHHVRIYVALQVCVAMVLALLPLYGVSLQHLYFAQFLIGFTYGPVFLLVTPMLMTQVGTDDLPVAFGTLMLSCGGGYVIAPPVGGLMYDIFGDYKVSYHIAGSTIALAALSVLPLLVKKDKFKEVNIKAKALSSASDGEPDCKELMTSSRDCSTSVTPSGTDSSKTNTDLSLTSAESDLTETRDLTPCSSYSELV